MMQKRIQSGRRLDLSVYFWMQYIMKGKFKAFIKKCQEGESVVIPSFEHSFCNALLSYSGDLKYKEAKLMHRANIQSENVPLLEVLKIPQKELQDILLIHKLHPELKMALEYYFDRFENIAGELCIVGMSPNNDQHIINMIRNNPNITDVICCEL